MSSWLARSLANSLGIDEGEDEESNNTDKRNRTEIFVQQRVKINEERDGDEVEPDSPSRRVQDDLSEFRETLTRQLWGVANFLAPPPQTTTPYVTHSDDRRDNRIESQVYNHHRLDSWDSSVSGIEDAESPVRGQNRYRFEAGGGSSGNEFSPTFEDNGRLVLNNLRLAGIYDRLGPVDEDDDEEEDDWISHAVGVTDEVLAFAGNIAHHPETWLDFPIEDDEDLEGFDMSESQKLHALAVEHLTPRLAALRFELCPAHMSEGYFWKVYLVLLHSRLNKHDAELLSTPQVMAARTKWMQELQKRAKEELEQRHGSFKYYKDKDFYDLPREGITSAYPHFEHSDVMPLWTSISEHASSSTTAESENEKHLAVGSDLQFVDKSIVEEKLVFPAANNKLAGLSSKVVPNFDNDDDDWWPEDDDSQNGKTSLAIHVGIDEDISFSDLEDDDCILPKFKVGPKD